MPIPIIDIFAGPGGLNEGFSHIRDSRGRAVFRTVASIECEPWAHRTLELRALFRKLRHEGDTANYYRYVREEITREELFAKSLDLAKKAKEEALLATLGESEAANQDIDRRIASALAETGSDECILIGGPPCQAYSLVGRARRAREDIEVFEADHKHFLYKEYLRIVRRFRPAVFLMENVTGLLSAKHSGSKMFEMICSDLRGAGYSLHSVNTPESLLKDFADPRNFVVHAEDFNVPQSRARVFILGLRNDLGLKASTLVRPKGEMVTVADVLSDLPKIRSRLSKEMDSVENWRNAIGQLGGYQFDGLDERFRSTLRDRLDTLPWSYGLGRRQMPKGDQLPERLSDWYSDRDCPVLMNHNSRGHMRKDLMRYFYWSHYASHFGRSPTLSDVPHFLRPAHGNVSGDAKNLPFGDRFRVQLKSKPSTTVVSHIAKDGHYYIHYEPKQCRSLSVREAARLQTFPDNYFFEGAVTDQYRQVGNAVPPYLASQIATVVHSILSGTRTQAAAV